MIWLITGWVFLLIESAATGNQNLNPEEVITLSPKVFVFASITITVVGLLVGIAEVMLLHKLFDRYSLSTKILLKFAFYLSSLFLVVVILYPLAASIELNLSPLDKQVWLKFKKYLLSIVFLSNIVQISFSLILSLLYAAVSDHLGHNVLLNFFSGKYHKPIKEQRIFMFLDMRSSTSIAEKLGHEKYFELLKMYYQAMARPIIDHEGTVYQYIGDEVVVTWKKEVGLNNANCIACFFAIQKSIQSLKDKFQSQFGLVPSFKGGLHLGEVTIGEVGALKKEIVFTGDVLNTTARIQSLCNEYKHDLIISGDLKLNLNSYQAFKFTSLASLNLRGKSELTELYAVNLPKPNLLL
ncbi:adenylate cyclase [Roseivirga ehrenbergii]|uniref:Adenylate cyclase n=1 Tax=Roseivirga ehrenbergii (strain DSM 102268 / JCM 13514 / KCTC 12282 / NCIMB 14502 / KMM 6017) TaxID=279360 RepID=A0A150XSP1_ROSEK|nr:adenylate cyclase [Roseivirga ehrenbergii]